MYIYLSLLIRRAVLFLICVNFLRALSFKTHFEEAWNKLEGCSAVSGLVSWKKKKTFFPTCFNKLQNKAVVYLELVLLTETPRH